MRREDGIKQSLSVEILRGENIAVKYGNSYVAVLDYEKLERFRDKFPVWKDATDFTLHI